MNTYHKTAKYLGVIGLVALASACKVEIAVPTGGEVQTQSGVFNCRAGQTCSVDVVDLFYDETFEAVAYPGYTFKGWSKTQGSFCGGTKAPCRLVTRGFEGNDVLLGFLASDRKFFLTPVFEPVPVIREEHLKVEGSRVPIAGGYNVDGLVKIDAGYSTDHEFRNANLKLRFDDKGLLLAMNGSSLLPRQLTRLVSVVGDTRAQVGIYYGREINANPAFEIQVQDDRQYLAFLVSSDVTLRVNDPTRTGQSELLHITTPASGKVVLVIDPADEMFYQYGEAAGVAYGKAESEQGLLPYIADVSPPGFLGFDGHQYETGTFPVGIKVFDVLSLTGATIIRQPQHHLVDLKDPFNAPVDYQAGFNGSAAFSFGVLGFGLLSFDLTQASASFNVTRKRQAMSLSGNIEPDVSWLPSWVPLVPATQLRGDFVATAQGQLTARIKGRYQSTLPRADLEGSINMTPRATTYSGQINHPTRPWKVSMTFGNRVVQARVDPGRDLSVEEEVEEEIKHAFDRAERRLKTETEKLDEATRNHDLELSMRGLRQAIPGMVDTAMAQLKRVPAIVYSDVYNGVRAGIDRRRSCNPFFCLPSDSKRNSEATKAARSARTTATSMVNAQISRLSKLKRLAPRTDDDTVQAELRSALLEVYNYRRLRTTIKVTVSIAGFKFSHSQQVDEQFIPISLATQIKQAADNLHRIPQTRDEKLRAQRIVASLPTQVLIDNARNKAQRIGANTAPGVRALSFTVKDGIDYTGSVILNNDDTHDVKFNLLDPNVARNAIRDIQARYFMQP